MFGIGLNRSQGVDNHLENKNFGFAFPVWVSISKISLRPRSGEFGFGFGLEGLASFEHHCSALLIGVETKLPDTVLVDG